MAADAAAVAQLSLPRSAPCILPTFAVGARMLSAPAESHVVKKMSPRLTTGKTVVKGGLELPQFGHEAFHIAGHEIKRRDGKALMIGPTGR